MNNTYIYTLEQGGVGIVMADSKEEAKEKVREAYEKHCDPEFCENIKVYGLSELKNRWFIDTPDVIEISDGFLEGNYV